MKARNIAYGTAIALCLTILGVGLTLYAGGYPPYMLKFRQLQHGDGSTEFNRAMRAIEEADKKLANFQGEDFDEVAKIFKEIETNLDQCALLNHKQCQHLMILHYCTGAYGYKQEVWRARDLAAEYDAMNWNTASSLRFHDIC